MHEQTKYHLQQIGPFVPADYKLTCAYFDQEHVGDELHTPSCTEPAEVLVGEFDERAPFCGRHAKVYRENVPDAVVIPREYWTTLRVVQDESMIVGDHRQQVLPGGGERLVVTWLEGDDGPRVADVIVPHYEGSENDAFLSGERVLFPEGYTGDENDDDSLIRGAFRERAKSGPLFGRDAMREMPLTLTEYNAAGKKPDDLTFTVTLGDLPNADPELVRHDLELLLENWRVHGGLDVASVNIESAGLVENEPASPDSDTRWNEGGNRVEPHVVLVGNPIDGMKIYGPFDDSGWASDFTMGIHDEHYTIVKLTDPTEIDGR